MSAMKIITDEARIRQVFAENAPRAPRMAEEMYPDATIDAQGRAHAPHDGYSTDGVTIFNGGEFLPEDPEAGRCGTTWSAVFYNAEKHEGCDPSLGAVFGLRGSPAQIRAARAEARAQEREFDKHAEIALPEGRMEARLMLVSCWPKKDYDTDIPDQYGRMDFELRDANLRLVRHTGTNLPARIIMHRRGVPHDLPDIGRWIDLKGTFTHWVSRRTGRTSVIMKRPAGAKRLSMPGEGCGSEPAPEHLPEDSVRHGTCAEVAAHREWVARMDAEDEERRAA